MNIVKTQPLKTQDAINSLAIITVTIYTWQQLKWWPKSMKCSVTKWGMTACISTPSAFEVPLKHTSKPRDQSRFALMSYRGHGGCSGTAQDIRPFTVGLKKRLQGSLGQKLKGGYIFNKWLMHCSKWKNISGRIGLCMCSRSKECMPVKKNRHRVMQW